MGAEGAARRATCRRSPEPEEESKDKDHGPRGGCRAVYAAGRGGRAGRASDVARGGGGTGHMHWPQSQRDFTSIKSNLEVCEENSFVCSGDGQNPKTAPRLSPSVCAPSSPA